MRGACIWMSILTTKKGFLKRQKLSFSFIHFDSDRGTPSFDECYHLGVQCYQLTAEIYLHSRKHQLAVCVYIEVASILQVHLISLF